MNAPKLRTLALAAAVPAALAAGTLAATPASAGPVESEDYYSVELTGAIVYSEQDTYTIYNVPAKVCVTAENPTSVNGWSQISIQPWGVVIEENDDKTTYAWDGIEAGPDEASGDFPERGSYRVGECAEGNLPIRVNHGSTIADNEVVWDSGLGQVETFSLDDAIRAH
ncbi:hypothetical protein ACF3NT_13405 [Naumannella halotolerans]|uniref:hypothetical protein n=1 Tax=Naumannella halotolerans TaxID=993414 RepID=UPI00370D7C8D